MFHLRCFYVEMGSFLGHSGSVCIRIRYDNMGDKRMSKEMPIPTVSAL